MEENEDAAERQDAEEDKADEKHNQVAEQAAAAAAAVRPRTSRVIVVQIAEGVGRAVARGRLGSRLFLIAMRTARLLLHAWPATAGGFDFSLARGAAAGGTIFLLCRRILH